MLSWTTRTSFLTSTNTKTAKTMHSSNTSAVIYDDDYGLWTEEDQAGAAAQAWDVLEADEAS